MRASSKPDGARTVGLLCLAALPPLAYLLIFKPPFDTTYWALAGNILQTGSLGIDGVRLTDYEPLYPVFLAVARVVTGSRIILVQLLQIGISAAGAVYLYRLSLTLGRSERAAAIAAVLYAFDPVLIRQAALPSDLVLVTTLLVAFAVAFVSIDSLRGAVVAGMWIGLAVLARTMVLPIALGGCALLLWERRNRAAAAFALAALLLIAPLAVRTHAVSGSWWPTRSGMNLYIGNSPYTAALLPDEDLDLLQKPASDLFVRARPDLSPSAPGYTATLDAFLAKSAFDYMASSPARTLRQKLMNVAYFLSPRLVPFRIATDDTRVVIGPGGVAVENSVPRPRAEVIAYALASSFILLTAVTGVYLRRHRLRRDAILWVVAATFIVVNALYVPASRYGAPMQFVLLFYSGVALSRLTRIA